MRNVPEWWDRPSLGNTNWSFDQPLQMSWSASIVFVVCGMGSLFHGLISDDKTWEGEVPILLGLGILFANSLSLRLHGDRVARSRTVDQPAEDKSAKESVE